MAEHTKTYPPLQPRFLYGGDVLTTNDGPQEHALDAYQVTGQSPGAEEFCGHRGDDAQDGSHEECRRIFRADAVTRVRVLRDWIVLHMGDVGTVSLSESAARDLRDRLTQSLARNARLRRQDAKWQREHSGAARLLRRMGHAR